MNVRFHHGGPFFLLHWTSDDTGGRLILARSVPALRSTAARVFHENPEAKILLAHCRIEIVAPSPRMAERAAEYDRKEAVDTFHREAVSWMRDRREKGLPLPPPFAVCMEYQRTPELLQFSSDWDLAHHSGCLHCMHGIRLLPPITPDVLYDRAHPGWQALLEKNPPWAEPRRPSRGVEALNDERLWYADGSSFMDHGRGIELRQMGKRDLDPVAAVGHRPACLDARVLFYFRRGANLGDDCQPLLDAAVATHRAKEEERVRAFTAEHDAQQAERLRAIAAHFEERFGKVE